MRLVSRYDYKEVMNQEETDEDTADKMSQEVDSRDEVMHGKQRSVIFKMDGLVVEQR